VIVNGMERRRSTLAPAVFYPAGGLILLFVLVTVLFADGVANVMSTLQDVVIGGFGWYYIVIVAAFLIFAVWMGVSRFGEITLGPDDEEPDFKLPVWFSMLFATGMGIGLVYFGVAEPLSHFVSPKPGVTGDEPQLAQAAIGQTYLHWGFHAWGIYVVVGLALAYAIHRKGRPASIRWALEPLLGEKRVRGWLGNVIDVVAIFGTVFGVATSLGLGVQQVAAGLEYLDVADATLALEMGLIVAITAVAAISVASGLEKGIKWLSNANMILAGVVLLVVLVAGSTLFILREWVQSIGYYFQNVMMMTFDTLAFQGADGLAWESSWTIFYWGWWISWAPFVGLFIARISRGRTVREFVLGTLLVPMIVTTVWFSVFGGSAIHQERDEPGSMLVPDAETGDLVVDSDTAMFQLFDSLPFGGPVLAVAALILVVVFFVTSSDSGSFVVDMLANGGDQNPPLWSRLFWAILEGGVAMALLYAGGLQSLQTAAILTALPFTVVMLGMAVAVWKALNDEYREMARIERRLRRRELTEHVTEHVTVHVTDHVTEHFADQVAEQVSAQVSELTGQTSAVSTTDGSAQGRRWRGPRKRRPGSGHEDDASG
jgi:choline/glycine/proline betaine transport protein